MSPTAPQRDFGEAFNRLRKAQKNSNGAPVYSRFINRPFGRVLAAGAYVLHRTPNQVTALSAVFTFSGIAVLAALPTSWVTGLVVSLLLIVGYALDSADGQLARLLGGGSPEGEWLDHVIDSAKLATIHLAVLVGMYRELGGPSWWLCVPLLFSAVQSVHFFGMIVTDLVLREHHYRAGAAVPYRAEVLGDRHSTLLTLARVPVDYGLLCLGFLLLAWYPAFVALYTGMAIASTGYLLLAARRWFRQVRATRSA
ncbi:MAG: CDP-alcohol phosphatidyltransferase family protein [Propionibacteriaceae bacterium]|nr:CDP-alcohol phosphatidyltransferase family protein [Propionibacteriaceae bacterium]